MFIKKTSIIQAIKNNNEEFMDNKEYDIVVFYRSQITLLKTIIKEIDKVEKDALAVGLTKQGRQIIDRIKFLIQQAIK